MFSDGRDWNPQRDCNPQVENHCSKWLAEIKEVLFLQLEHYIYSSKYTSYSITPYLHFCFISFLCVKSEAFPRSGTSSSTSPLLSWRFANCCHQKRLNSDSRIIYLLEWKQFMILSSAKHEIKIKTTLTGHNLCQIRGSLLPLTISFCTVHLTVYLSFGHSVYIPCTDMVGEHADGLHLSLLT